MTTLLGNQGIQNPLPVPGELPVLQVLHHSFVESKLSVFTRRSKPLDAEAARSNRLATLHVLERTQEIFEAKLRRDVPLASVPSLQLRKRYVESFEPCDKCIRDSALVHRVDKGLALLSNRL